MKAGGQNLAFAHKDAAHTGVGCRGVLALPGLSQRQCHPVFVLLRLRPAKYVTGGRRGAHGRRVSLAISSEKLCRSSKLLYTEAKRM